MLSPIYLVFALAAFAEAGRLYGYSGRCIGKAIAATGCSSSNSKCICSSNQFMETIKSCTTSDCEKHESDAAIFFAEEFCNLVGGVKEPLVHEAHATSGDDFELPGHGGPLKKRNEEYYEKHYEKPHEKPHGEHYGKHGEHHDEHYGKSHDDHYGKHHDDYYGKHHDDHYGKPHDDHYGKPHDDHYGKHHDDHYGKHHDDHYGKPHGEHGEPHGGHGEYGGHSKHPQPPPPAHSGKPTPTYSHHPPGHTVW